MRTTASVGATRIDLGGNLPVATGLLLAYQTTLIVVLYDTYRPVRAARDSLRRRSGAA